MRTINISYSIVKAFGRLNSNNITVAIALHVFTCMAVPVLPGHAPVARRATSAASEATPPVSAPAANGTTIFFRRAGDTVSNIEYVNVAIPTRTSVIRGDLAKLKPILEDHVNDWDMGPAQRLEHHLLVRRLDQVLLKLDHFGTMFDEIPDSNNFRIRRFDPITGLVLLITAAVIAATAYGVYTAVELAQVKDNINTISAATLDDLVATKRLSHNQRDIAVLLDHLAELSSWTYGDIMQSRLAETIIALAEAEVAYLGDVLGHAAHGRLHPAMMDSLPLVDLARTIKRDAMGRGLIPIQRHFTDWLQMEASFIAGNNSGDFDVILHVPVYPPGMEMPVFRFIPMPVKLSDELLVTINTPFDFIAVGKDTFFTMTSADHDTCRLIGGLITCPHNSVARRIPHNLTSIPYKDPALCLLALYKHELAAATSLCHFSILKNEPAVTQLSRSTFAVYSPVPETATIYCRNHSLPPTQELRLSGSSIVTLPSTCSARSSSFIFASSDPGFASLVEDVSHQFIWANMSSDITASLNSTDEGPPSFADIAAEALKIASTSGDTATLDGAISHLRAPPISWHSYATPSAAALAFFAILLAIVLYCCSCRRNTPPSPQLLPNDSPKGFIPTAPPPPYRRAADAIVTAYHHARGNPHPQ